MKKCSNCNKIQSLDSFSNNGKQAWCKKCVRAKNKLHYENNKEIYAKHNKKNKDKKREFFDSFKKGKKCEKCGEDRIITLDFHHLDPTQKEFSIGEIFNSSYINRKEKITEEIKKCIVLCSNCHRMFHFLERQNNLTIENFLKS